MYKVSRPKPNIDVACQECDGYGYHEDIIGTEQGRSDGATKVAYFTCERCGGSGEEPEPTDSENENE
jgi:DnaJ-class molecular chaperone